MLLKNMCVFLFLGFKGNLSFLDLVFPGGLNQMEVSFLAGGAAGLCHDEGPPLLLL